MRFTTATVIAALPFLVAGAPSALKDIVKVPLSKRSNLVDKYGVVDVAALNDHRAKAITKFDRGFRNYEKNMGAPHPNAKGIQKRDSGTAVALTDDGSNQLWQGKISVGTPAVTYTVDFDTGSSDLFLPGPDCKTNCDGHTIYRPSSSSTAQDLHKTFSLAYGDKSTVSGEQYTDTVQIAGCTATTQTLGAASKYSDGFSINQFAPDGLMGMAFQSISQYNAAPVFQTLVAQGQVTTSVFAFKLSTSDSELFIGGIDTSKFTGEISYTPVTKNGYWQVNMDSVIGDGQTILSNVDSIIDTGTTLIVGDTENVATLYKAINGKDASSTVGPGYYTFPCDNVPSVSFTFGGTAFTISPSTFNIGQVSAGSSDCVGGITAGDQSFWIVGDVFLTNVYSVFDLDNTQVGFADLA